MPNAQFTASSIEKNSPQAQIVENHEPAINSILFNEEENWCVCISFQPETCDACSILTGYYLTCSDTSEREML